MVLKRILIITGILAIFLTPFKSVEASTLPIGDYTQYDSFMKRYHEHTMELSYFMNTSYKSNDHYFKENYQLFRDVVNNTFDTHKSEIVNSYLDSGEKLLSKPIALLGTANDLRRTLWEKVKNFFTGKEVDSNVNYGYNTQWNQIWAPDGYEFVNLANHNLKTSTIGAEVNGYNECYRIAISVAMSGTQTVFRPDCSNYNGLPMAYYEDLKQRIASGLNMSIVAELYSISNKEIDFHLVRIGEPTDTRPILVNATPAPITNLTNNIINELDTSKFNEDYTPTVVPQLLCPTGVVDLTFTNGQFKTKEGQIVLIGQNETSTYLDEVCNLDFKFPEVYYHEDTGKLIVGGNDLVSSEPVKDIDYGIIDYIKNSYDYATTAISTAVKGLESIGSSVIALGTFVGSVFVFLPPEMTIFIMSAFALACGLWVIKK